MFNQIDAQINCHICLIIDWWTSCASILAKKNFTPSFMFFAENMIIIVSTVNKFPDQAFHAKTWWSKTRPQGEDNTLALCHERGVPDPFRGTHATCKHLLLGSLIILEMKAISCFLIVYFFLEHFYIVYWNQNINTNKILCADLPFQVNRWYIFFRCHFLFRRAWKYQITKLNKTTEEIAAMNTKKQNI